MRSRRVSRRRPKDVQPVQAQVEPLTSDWASAIWNLTDSARILAQDLPGKHDFVITLLLSEVRRILRRGEDEP